MCDGQLPDGLPRHVAEFSPAQRESTVEWPAQLPVDELRARIALDRAQLRQARARDADGRVVDDLFDRQMLTWKALDRKTAPDRDGAQVDV